MRERREGRSEGSREEEIGRGRRERKGYRCIHMT